MAPAGILCDVRDVAQCHVKALLLPESAGQRFGIATREHSFHDVVLKAGTFSMQVLLDHVHAEPELVEAFPDAVKGTPGQAVPVQNWFDCSKSQKALSMQPRSEKETA